MAGETERSRVISEAGTAAGCDESDAHPERPTTTASGTSERRSSMTTSANASPDYAIGAGQPLERQPEARPSSAAIRTCKLPRRACIARVAQLATVPCRLHANV